MTTVGNALTTAARPFLRHLWKSTLAFGVLAIVLGILALAWPGRTILVAAILFGIFLLFNGISQVFFAFSLDVAAGGRILLFISGAASLVLAILCFRNLPNSILLLAIWVGVGFIFRGVATAVSAISDPGLHGRFWEIFIGVISLLAGIVMLAAPFTSLVTLTLVFGIWMVVIGLFEIISAFGIRSAGKELSRADEPAQAKEATATTKQTAQ